MGEWQQRLVDYFCVCGVDLEDSASQESIQSSVGVTPRVLQHYPAVPRPGFAAAEFADALPIFCFPDGDLRAQPAPTRPSVFSLICSEPDGQRYYAFVLSYSVRARCAPTGWAQAFLPTCWVVVSHWPFFEQFRLALLELYRLAWRACPSTWSSHVVQLCDEIPLPPRGQLKVTSVFFEQLLVFSRPPVNRLPMLDGAHLARLFTCLSPENVLQLVASLATEQRIVLLSEKRETLTMVAQAALLLLFPFCEWPHALITVLPTSLADYLHAPVPYLIGLEVESEDDFVATGLWKGADCTCFDLRADTVTFHPRQPPPDIPEHQAEKLLQACHASVLAVEGREARERALRRGTDTAQPQVQPLAAEHRGHTWAPEQEAELGLSWIATEIGTRMMGSNSERLADGSDGADIMTIRHAYLRFFVSLLKNYKRFKLEPGGTDRAREKVTFDLDAFVENCDSPTQNFVRALVNTQAFQIFINADDQDGFNRVLFDESIEMKLNRSIRRRNSPVSCPFLAASWAVDREYEAPVPSDGHSQEGDQNGWSLQGVRIAELCGMRAPTRVPNFVETLDRPMAVALQEALQGRAHTEVSLTSAVKMFQRQLEQAAVLSVQGAVRVHFARNKARAARRVRAIVRIQKVGRMYRARAAYRADRESIIKLQRLTRSRMARRLQAIVRMQKFGRMYRARAAYRAERESIIKLQRLTRSRMARAQFVSIQRGTLLAQAFVRGAFARATFHDHVAQPALHTGLTNLWPYWRALGVSLAYTSTLADTCLKAEGMAGFRVIDSELARMRSLQLTLEEGLPVGPRGDTMSARRSRGLFSCACGPSRSTEGKRRPGLGVRIENNLDDDLLEARAEREAVRQALYSHLAGMNNHQLNGWFSALNIPREGRHRKARLLSVMETEACNDGHGMASQVHALVISVISS